MICTQGVAQRSDSESREAAFDDRSRTGEEASENERVQHAPPQQETNILLRSRGSDVFLFKKSPLRTRAQIVA